MFKKNDLKYIVQVCYKHVDKLLHFLVTYTIVITAILFNLFGLGLGVVVVLSVLKEYIDEWLFDGFSWGDLLFDFIGVLAAIGVGALKMVI